MGGKSMNIDLPEGDICCKCGYFTHYYQKHFSRYGKTPFGSCWYKKGVELVAWDQPACERYRAPFRGKGADNA